MSADATWFGPTDRPLAGWLHLPDDGAVRAGVVLCPPVGLEYVASHRTIRVIAEQLAARGIGALRFDYDGTGDSAGTPDDADRVTAWQESIRHAMTELQTTIGTAPVALLGLRVGATLLTSVLSTPIASQEDAAPPLALVLWDPCVSGRRFLRQQKALGRLVGCHEQPDGAIDAPGFRYTADTVRDVGRMDISGLSSLPVPEVLVLTRPSGDPTTVLPEQPGATRDVVDGMPQLLDVQSIEAVVPESAVTRCVSWLDAALPTQTVAAHPHLRAEALVADGVIERHLRLGPLGLTAVETTGPGTAAGARPVLLLNNGAENHIGPVRLWPELARSWAGAGVRSIRVDISGVGDSPTRPGRDDDVMYSPFDEQDVLSAVQAIDAKAPPVFVGLCSGAHLALRVGAALPQASVVAANIATAEYVPPVRVGPHLEFGLSRPGPRRLLRALGLLELGRRHLHRLEALLTTMPAAFWITVSRLRLARSPARSLGRLAGTDATLIVGPEDAVGYLTKGRWDLEQAKRAGLEFTPVADLDHVPMPYRQRVAVKEMLTSQVLRRTT